MVVWVSIPLLLLAALIPADLPSVPATLVGEVAWYNIGLLFAIVLVVLYVGCLLLRRPLKGLLPSLVVVFAVSLLAQVVTVQIALIMARQRGAAQAVAVVLRFRNVAAGGALILDGAAMSVAIGPHGL